MSKEKQSVCSATLIVLGSDLDPDIVSQSLGVNPDRAWRKGERKYFSKGDGSTHYFDSYHQRGGWKCFISADRINNTLEEQIAYWSEVLKKRMQKIRELQELGYRFIIDCCIVSTTESLQLSAEMQRELGGLNVELDITFYAHQDVDQGEV